MIFELQPEEYSRIWPLVRELAECFLVVRTVVEGSTPGRVLVDDAAEPQAAYIDTPEGSFVAGDPGDREFISSLRGETPYLIDLRDYPESWQPWLGEIVRNRVARRHLYRYYTFEEQRMGDWRRIVPSDCVFRMVDAEILTSGLSNIDRVSSGIEENWHTFEDFFEKGFCFVIVHDGRIVSLCESDCVSGDRCELGVWTDSVYRGRGLATLVVAGTVDYCLSRGLSRIGWHCIDTNIGSMRVVEKVGFRRARDYRTFGTELPAANASDLDGGTWRVLAEEYEASSDVAGDFIFRAAECWALAGEYSRSLEFLNLLIDVGWLTPDLAYLLNSWPFDGLRDESGWKELSRRLEK